MFFLQKISKIILIKHVFVSFFNLLKNFQTFFVIFGFQKFTQKWQKII